MKKIKGGINVNRGHGRDRKMLAIKYNCAHHLYKHPQTLLHCLIIKKDRRDFVFSVDFKQHEVFDLAANVKNPCRPRYVKKKKNVRS